MQLLSRTTLNISIKIYKQTNLTKAELYKLKSIACVVDLECYTVRLGLPTYGEREFVETKENLSIA